LVPAAERLVSCLSFDMGTRRIAVLFVLCSERAVVQVNQAFVRREPLLCIREESPSSGKAVGRLRKLGSPRCKVVEPLTVLTS
jgi:hypothetical protein